jgi:hypothetical protein
VISIGFVVFGLLFAVTSNIKYAAGDVRGTAAHAFIIGGVAIAVGIVVLLSIPVPRRQGTRRPRNKRVVETSRQLAT